MGGEGGREARKRRNSAMENGRLARSPTALAQVLPGQAASDRMQAKVEGRRLKDEGRRAKGRRSHWQCKARTEHEHQSEHMQTHIKGRKKRAFGGDVARPRPRLYTARPAQPKPVKHAAAIAAPYLRSVHSTAEPLCTDPGYSSSTSTGSCSGLRRWVTRGTRGIVTPARRRTTGN